MPMRPIHFVGSIPGADAEAVFRAISVSAGSAAPRWPDGETGDRLYWIRWQVKTFDDHPDFELKSISDRLHGYKDQLERPFYVFRDGVDPASVEIASLGYADAARASYRVFTRLRGEGVVPDRVRFQVSIPTAVALAVGFFEQPERAAAEKVIEAGLAREVASIAASIPASDLAIQWDVCHEVVAADGGMPLHYDDIVPNSIDRVARHLGFVPDSVQVGLHLCYGDPGHKHIIEPENLATCVAYANGVSAAAARSVDFIHMPVPRDRNDDAYFAPLAGLDLPSETQLFLGLVHYTDGVDGTRDRLDTAVAHAGPDFGIATECGFGRRDPATIPELIDIHLRASA